MVVTFVARAASEVDDEHEQQEHRACRNIWNKSRTTNTIADHSAVRGYGLSPLRMSRQSGNAQAWVDGALGAVYRSRCHPRLLC